MLLTVIFIADNYIVISSGVLFCDPKTSSPEIRIRIRPDLSSYIRPGSAPAGF